MKLNIKSNTKEMSFEFGRAEHSGMLGGCEFQGVEAATEKARSPLMINH